MVKSFDKKWNIRYNDVLKQNDKDQVYVLRLLYWRNLQIQDNEFDRKKQKVVWPLYTFENEGRKTPNMAVHFEKPGEPKKIKYGFNQQKFKQMDSVKKVNEMAPLFNLSPGKRKKKNINDKFAAETDSEDEWQKKDFFEESVFWQHTAG